MTTYEKIKQLNDLVQRMSGMYSNMDKRSQQMAKGYELRALEMIKELQFEEKGAMAEVEYLEAYKHFVYFRKLTHKCYVSANRDSPAFDYEFSYTDEAAEKSLRAKIGEDGRDLFFWSVFVHPNGDEEKFSNDYPL